MGVYRKAQDVAKVPLKASRALKLKDEIILSTNSGREIICLPEMSLLLSCLKNSNFVQEACQTEIAGFQKCYTAYKASSAARKTQKLNKAGSEDIQNLLKKYPNI